MPDIKEFSAELDMLDVGKMKETYLNLVEITVLQLILCYEAVFKQGIGLIKHIQNCCMGQLVGLRVKSLNKLLHGNIGKGPTRYWNFGKFARHYRLN